MYDGFFNTPASMPLLSNARTRSISAENPTGEKGAGALATTGTGEKPARNLGKGWKVSPCVSIPAGETIVLADIEGPGAIQSIWMAGYVGRDLILRFYWEDQEIPSAQSPLSDFFACGWYDNSGMPLKGPFSLLNSMMVCVNPNRALNCFWVMPFKKRCRITAENRAKEPRVLYYQINYVLTELPDEIGYFHAQFRRVNPLPYKEDYVILDGVSGKGQYVGTALSVGLNGLGMWWGEGEIKFFMDGDRETPTICGTGTEDYFLGAFDWDVDGQYRTYSGPYAGMYYAQAPDGMYASQQRFSMYRWHVTDPIRFEKELRVTLQDLGWYRDGTYQVRQDDFASVAYWYQTLPAPPQPPLPDTYYLEVT